MEELKLNHTYLLQFGNGDMLSSVTILMVTDKAYRIQWNNNSKHTTWEQKKIFNRNYVMIEDISDFIVEDKISTIKTKLIKRPICHGFGYVPDEKSTGGTTPCPLCHGSKMIPESIET
ncbi:MAG: hypothetical protein PF487_04570 [Bacteroidales bacterium]|jgi:hypothetical protein|nr:hypothetical protein [Bacteroidales bacterium]